MATLGPIRCKLLTSLTAHSCDDFALRILSTSATAIFGRFSGLSTPMTSGERMNVTHALVQFPALAQLSMLQVTETWVGGRQG